MDALPRANGSVLSEMDHYQTDQQKCVIIYDIYLEKSSICIQDAFKATNERALFAYFFPYKTPINKININSQT